ncbi:MAG: formylglycine-generating enzyme family protein [Treponema sp.]|nr:formylglycine-generating enzyme family protein [Treponema sp.]
MKKILGILLMFVSLYVWAQQSAPDGFVSIQGGTFVMGSPPNEPQRSNNEGPQRQVTLDSFYMSKFEVTQAEYELLTGVNPSRFKGNNLPVENVSWFDAVEYCNLRSEREGLNPAYSIRGSGNNRLVSWIKNSNGYRLPTEAEWEYACRAGTTTPFNTGDNITTDQANFDGNYPYNKNAKGPFRDKTTVAGSLMPNNWGLYDMHGNVWEWCWDSYGAYSSDPETNPEGSTSSSGIIGRGGSWDDTGQHLRSACRNLYAPSYLSSDLGFRIVRQ